MASLKEVGEAMGGTVQERFDKTAGSLSADIKILGKNVEVWRQDLRVEAQKDRRAMDELVVELSAAGANLTFAGDRSVSTISSLEKLAQKQDEHFYHMEQFIRNCGEKMCKTVQDTAKKLLASLGKEATVAAIQVYLMHDML